MKIPNGFFGNGPGLDEENTRDQDAYMRNRLQMTVATSTFAGVALVGMFCSCIWFACCRNSSSKTRKKARTWAAGNPEAWHQNPYSYEGYPDGQGYAQMNNNDGGVAPYMNNPLYPPGSMYTDGGLTNAYDFNDHFGFNQGGKAQMSTLFGSPTSPYTAAPITGTNESNLKDVPPSYTALFFAANDPSSGIGGKGTGATGDTSGNTCPRVTSIQPIHLKVTSNVDQQKHLKSEETKVNATKNADEKKYCRMEEDDIDEDFVHRKEDPCAGPVSLLSVESDPGKVTKEESRDQNKTSGNDKKLIPEEGQETPPPYNPGKLRGSGSRNVK